MPSNTKNACCAPVPVVVVLGLAPDPLGLRQVLKRQRALPLWVTSNSAVIIIKAAAFIRVFSVKAACLLAVFPLHFRQLKLVLQECLPPPTAFGRLKLIRIAFG